MTDTYAIRLLEMLAERNVTLTANGDQLEVKAPKGALTSVFRDALIEHKAGLMEVLQRRDAQWAANTLGPGGWLLWVRQTLRDTPSVNVTPRQVQRIMGCATVAEVRAAIDEAANSEQVLETCWRCGGDAWWTRRTDGARVCGVCYPDPRQDNTRRSEYVNANVKPQTDQPVVVNDGHP